MNFPWKKTTNLQWHKEKHWMILVGIDAWWDVSSTSQLLDQNCVMRFISYPSLCKSPRKNIWMLLIGFSGISKALLVMGFCCALIVIFKYVPTVMQIGLLALSLEDLSPDILSQSADRQFLGEQRNIQCFSLLYGG